MNRESKVANHVQIAVRNLVEAAKIEAPEFGYPFEDLMRAQRKGQKDKVAVLGQRLDTWLREHKERIPLSVRWIYAAMGDDLKTFFAADKPKGRVAT